MSQLARAGVAVVATAVATAVLVQGMGLRFHIENTDEALAAERQGGLWLVGSMALYAVAAAASVWADAPRWAPIAIASPIIAGVIPALLLPGNIIPFATALVSACAAGIGAIATIVSAARR